MFGKVRVSRMEKCEEYPVDGNGSHYIYWLLCVCFGMYVEVSRELAENEL